MMTDPRFNKWCRWMLNIERDVERLFFHRKIFMETKDVVEKNERLDLRHPYFSFFVITYVDSTLMGIRRQIKNDKTSISLARLLAEIAENPQLITRSGYYELHQKYRGKFPPHIVDKTREENFNKYASPDSLFIDAALVRRDLQTFKKACEEAESFADRRIAHLDKRKDPVDLNLDTIFKSLEMLEMLVKKYHLLFFAQDISLTPGLPSPVSDIFKEPWLKSSSRS
jgi:hypothetical protein